jgi:putative oxidoreductase
MIKNMLAPFSDRFYALLRVVAGLMFSFHGIQKLFGVLTAHQPAVGSQLWIGGVIELVTGVAIAIGFFTSCAAFVASGTMAVAYIQFHWKLAGGSQLFPAVNQGELALLYSFVFLFIASRGAGPWSVDSRRAKAGGHS